MSAAIYVQDKTGQTFFVGERPTMAQAEETAEILNRDPLCAGQRFWAEDDEWPSEPFDNEEDA